MASEDERKPEEGVEDRGRDDRDRRDDDRERSADRRDDDRDARRDDDRRDDDRRDDDRRDDDRRDDRDRQEGGGNGGKRRGKVARWNGERGFGFITPDEGGPDVFCHITAITDGNALPESGTVEYDVSFDDRQGKERAQNVTGGHEINRNGGFSARDPGGANGSGKLNGTVARWNGERGFGFITPTTGGEDIFCHTSSITDGAALPEGGKVTFDQEYDDKRGKEHAINVAGGCEERRRESSRYDDGGYGGRGGGDRYDDRGDRGGYGGGRDRYDDRGGRGGDRYDDGGRGGDRYDDRRGGYDDRRGGGGYDDRRGGDRYDDRGYDDRRGGRY